MVKDNFIHVALFDLDGVVFDTEGQYTRFWGTQARIYHPEIPDLEQGELISQIDYQTGGRPSIRYSSRH